MATASLHLSALAADQAMNTGNRVKISEKARETS